MEQFNAEKFRCSDVVLPYVEPLFPRAKDAPFASMCDFPEKDIKLPKCSCVLNCCSECNGVFVPDAENNCEEDVNLPLIIFHH